MSIVAPFMEYESNFVSSMLEVDKSTFLSELFTNSALFNLESINSDLFNFIKDYFL